MAVNNAGKVFEKNFKEYAKKDGLWNHRVADSELSFCGSINTKFTNKSTADLFIFHKRFFVLELKSTKHTSISIQRTEEGDGMIKLHQINSLITHDSYENVNGCFVLNFRKEEGLGDESTYILSIKDFSDFLVMETKSSINEQDVVRYGGILCNQQRKRKYFTYEVKDLLEKFIQKKEVI